MALYRVSKNDDNKSRSSRLSSSSSPPSSSSSPPRRVADRAVVDIAYARTTTRRIFRNGLDENDDDGGGDTSRSNARDAVDRVLCPPDERYERDDAGMEAYDDVEVGGVVGDVRRPLDGGSSRRRRSANVAMTNDDPRGEYTYGEFPFGSFDALVDRASIYVDAIGDVGDCDEDDVDDYEDDRRTGEGGRRHTMVDLGSGCGRLVLYAALTRGMSNSAKSNWDVHGIEIGTRLHSLAIRSLRRGVDNGWFEYVDATMNDADDAVDGDDKVDNDGGRIISFHNGNALSSEDPYFTNKRPRTSTSSDHTKDDESSSSSAPSPTYSSTYDSIRSLLSRTDLIFAYSTVWETSKIRPYDTNLGAMVLSSKWSRTLASTCKDGCIAITTDRVLDPEDGWRLLDRMEVDNPAVWGSVGYISVLEKGKGLMM